MNRENKESNGRTSYNVGTQLPAYIYEQLKKLAEAEDTSMANLTRRSIKLLIACVHVEMIEPTAGLYLHRPGQPPQHIFLIEQQDYGRRRKNVITLPLELL